MLSHEGSDKVIENSPFDVLQNMPDFDMTEMRRRGEDDPKKLENFRKLVDFFDKDMSIKKSLVDLAPSGQKRTTMSDVEYADKFYNDFLEIKSNLKEIMQNYYKSKEIDQRLQQIEDNIINSGVDSRKLSLVYQNDLISMSKEFNDGVREEAVGYSIWSNPHVIDEDARSINEILHLIHSSIVNNENTFKELPILKKDTQGMVTLYGTPNSMNDVSLGIFEGIKDARSPIDIAAIEDRTIMMVRDRGHALTLDIQKDDDGKYYIDYFIPKICNVDKVNLLPGVRKVQKKEGLDQALEYTTGIFSLDQDSNVADEVLNFISMVPTDEDME